MQVLLIAFGILCCTVLKNNGQRLVYNKTFCNEDNLSSLQTLLPKFPTYTMSISSSTYQAGKPISIEVKSCKDNGFRAFLLRASVKGYFLAYADQDFKNTELGTITISCGVKKRTNVSYNFKTCLL